jgi:tRNA threonylcarbamoyladenosine biosynthesis protein TsaB
MANILAIDTATDACSVALLRDGIVTARQAVVPREHFQRLFRMLRELLPDGDLAAAGVDAVAYSRGPGSFTGLRITASAVQGICFAHDLPAIGISTLACQAQAALREGLVAAQDRVLSLLDARIDELYWSLLEFDNGVAREIEGPAVCAPEQLQLRAETGSLVGVGSGLCYAAELPASLRQRLAARFPHCRPAAQDLLPTASLRLQSGLLENAVDVAPQYVRNEITWKKIAEQGKHK